METKLVLTFTDQSGREQRVVSRAARITLGRDAGNVVAIDDSNLSRHHAVIENVRESIRISDCNSLNGTMVNGQPFVGVVELFDGDVVNLGGSCDIAVGFQRSARTTNSRQVSVPVIAVSAVAVILVSAAVLLALSVWSEPFTSSASINSTEQQIKDDTVADPGPPSAKLEKSADVVSDNSTDQIAVAVKRVMGKLSKDNAPYISDTGINDVKRKLEEYRGSIDLKERLRAAKQGCPEISAEAERINVRPALLMYAALADEEGQFAGNPITAARRMTPRLLSLRATFGTETANSSLLLIAAYPYPFNPPIGSQTRTPHPLASKLVEIGGRRSTVETAEARSVWFLREKNAITEEAYKLVIRLLAIGMIAQNPHHYGIDAEPLFC